MSSKVWPYVIQLVILVVVLHWERNIILQNLKNKNNDKNVICLGKIALQCISFKKI